MHGHLTLTQLKEEEARIFGGVGNKERKSKIILDVYDRRIRTGNYTPLPHHTGKSDCEPCNDVGQKICKKAFKLPCFLPGSEFTLKVSVIEDNEVDKQYLESLIQLSIFLGGLGKRSRRGFGAINIKLINGETISNDTNLDFILKLLNNVVPNRFRMEDNAIKLNKLSNHLPNYPFIELIEIGKEFSNWNALLGSIGLATHKYNNPAKDCSLGRVRGKKRFASPIFVSVITSGAKYYPIITTLHGAPKDVKCHISKKKQRDFIANL
ncbi:MAG: hypothetical protein Kow0042_20630 [Calditrichia bacterium]